MAVAGNCAYVADGSAGLRVVSVADPAHPSEVGYYDTPGYAEGVAVAGDYAYVADGSAGLRVISAADPAHPSEVGYYDTPSYVQGVAVAGNYAYAAEGSAGLRVISVADPAHPSEVGYYDTPSSARGVVVAGNYVYVADERAGLRVIEFYGAGVAETPSAEVRATNAGPTIVRGVLRMGDRGQKTQDRAVLLNAAGRKVRDLQPGTNDVRMLSPGVYFVRENRVQPSTNVYKVIITD
jgi:hypothetical protein